jgi:hypothetical protein
MSEQGMTRLEADVRAMVLGAGGDPGLIKTVFAANLRTTPFGLFSAWDELARLGAEDRHRIPADVEWARGLVNEVLQALGMGSDGRWRNLMPVARGIVDLIAGEIQSYRRQRGGGTGSMTTRVLVVTLGILALATSASGDGTWVLWSQLYTPGAGDWVRQTAYSTATECTEAIDYRGVLTPKNGFTIDRRSRTDLFLMDQSRARGLLWQRLPDTDDPRGPKAK